MIVYKKPRIRTQHEPVAWIPQVLAALALQRAGIWSSRSVASYRTPDRKVLDVRLQAPWKSATGEFNIPGLLDPTFAKWAAIWSQQQGAFRTADRVKLNTSQINPESMAWLKATLSLVDPASTFTWASGRSSTIYRKTFPRLNFEDTSWITPVAVQQLPVRSGIFSSQAASFRTADRAKLDPRTIQFDQATAYIQSFLNADVGASVSQYGPPVWSQSASFRTKESPALDPRWQQLKERKFGIPFNPALFVGILSQRSDASYRTYEAKRLMTVLSEWDRNADFTAPGAQSPVPAQSPAWVSQTMSFRTKESAALDVRYSPSQPSTGWEVYQIDSDLRSWTPAFAELSNSFRTPAGNVLDTRGIHYDQFGWLDSALNLTDPPKAKKSDHRLTSMGAGR